MKKIVLSGLALALSLGAGCSHLPLGKPRYSTYPAKPAPTAAPVAKSIPLIATAPQPAVAKPVAAPAASPVPAATLAVPAPATKVPAVAAKPAVAVPKPVETAVPKPVLSSFPATVLSAPPPVAAPAPVAAPVVSATREGGGGAYRLKPNDPLVIAIRGIPQEQQIECLVDETGNVNLPFIGAMRAADKTSSELERDIERTYIENQIYKYPSVNIVIPAQSYYVRGEVRQPGRYPLMSGVSLLQAVAAAGGYTEFADKTKVQVVRGRQTFRTNMRELEKYPDRDIDVEAGDVITVPRSFF